MASDGGQNLTGVWDGLYSYPDTQTPVPFVATLLDSGGFLGGTAHEQGPGRGSALLLSTLSGHRAGHVVAFRKTYALGSGPEYDTVDYSGAANADGTLIEGDWTIPGHLSGRFVMTRPRREELAVARKVAETV
jgi:hypothetical protein